MQIISHPLSVFGVLVFFWAYFNLTNGQLNKKPHIIFILSDDMGWNDVSFHGSDEIPTPNIDALAYNGIILNRHYVLPICSPSRSSLLTGRYALRDGMQGIPLSPGELRGIPLNRTLMPEYLKKLDYSTNLVGKWHVGYYTDNHTPTRRGFDTFYGYYNGYISYFNHSLRILDSDLTVHTGRDFHRDDPKTLRAIDDSGYFTEFITDEAVKIISSHGNEKPLFLQVNHLAVHANGNMNGDNLEVPNIQENDSTFPYIKDAKRRKYAGMMKSLDESVGRIVVALSGSNMLRDSIIVFASDNGAPTFDLFGNKGSNYPLRGIKNTLFEGGVRGVACIFSTLIKSPGRVSEETMHIVDWLPTFYAAAGGNPDDLGENIDGKNQWPTLVEGIASPRDSMLLNIDEVTGGAAAALGKYKIIKGADMRFGGYYGESGDDPTYPSYHVEDALSSSTGLAISQLSGFNSPSTKKAQNLRQKSTLQCKQAKIYPDCSTLCLFDVQNDPCETKDLSKDRPEIVKELESFISDYQKHLISQGSTIKDPLSYAENFNGTWMPWRKDEIL